MKLKLFFFIFTISTINIIFSQTIFEEDFETKVIGLDLTTEGYLLSQNDSYTGTVTAVVTESDGNKFARLNGSVNASAGMEISKTISVEEGKAYTFSNITKGPFKRQLRIYSLSNEILASNTDYKPSTTAEETAWKNLEVSFVVGAGITQVKIAIHHYWSGTLDIDNLNVEEIERQTKFYISSSEGDDTNLGTIDAPWETLDKISAENLYAGDEVYFKKGDQFNGHFVVNGSGSETYPILITSYGNGDVKPIISGQVGASEGGDYQEAILVENNDNMIFDGLEVKNERLTTKSGVSDEDAFGLFVKNSGTEIMQNFIFRNMTFSNVFAPVAILDPNEFDSIQVSGLSFLSGRNTVSGEEKHIKNVLVEDCYFTNLQRFGIQIKHSGGNEGIGDDMLNRNMDFIVRNSEFYYNGGTGVLPNGTYNCLIENNIFDHPGATTDPRMPGRGSSIWNINCINTIMQYNMCISTRGYLDSYGIHIDNWNTNTFVQYNYMEDCEGGFVEILKGNKNAVYRFNVSINDGWRVNPSWADSNNTIWVNADRWGEPEDFKPSDGVYIYNKTVVIDDEFTTAISLDGKNMFVYNNIFSSTNNGGMGVQKSIVRDNDTPYFMSNNLFEGTVNQDWIDYDTNPVLGSPSFNGIGENRNAYQLQAESLAIDAGTPTQGPVVPGAGTGIFIDIPSYPNVDAFGNPIDLSSGTPNIGVCNAKNGELLNVQKLDNEAVWKVYPNPTTSKIYFKANNYNVHEIEVSLISLNGQTVLKKKLIINSNNEFALDLDASISKGIYFLNISNKENTQSRRIILH